MYIVDQTLRPQLGVVRSDEREFVLADLLGQAELFTNPRGDLRRAGQPRPCGFPVDGEHCVTASPRVRQRQQRHGDVEDAAGAAAVRRAVQKAADAGEAILEPGDLRRIVHGQHGDVVQQRALFVGEQLVPERVRDHLGLAAPAALILAKILIPEKRTVKPLDMRVDTVEEAALPFDRRRSYVSGLFQLAPPLTAGPEQFEEFISSFGYSLTAPSNNLHPKHFQKLVTRMRGTPEEKPIAFLMLRTMQKARYDPANLGHFGLAADTYTHFTSPIRRYPDLVCHRALLSAIPVLEVNLDHSSRQHRLILDAVLKGETTKARRVMESHCDDTAALLRGLLA